MALKVNDNGIDRNMTDEEQALFVESKNNYKVEKQSEAQVVADRQALKEATLAKLGLTADEVAALLS
jgi:phosphopantetheinyl transferase (holo-ACP synthase)